jgi:natural product precursor
MIMKKLEKLNLKQMEQEMPVINSEISRTLTGGYDNDCFWRCVTYMETGFNSVPNAESRAEDYYMNVLGLTPSQAQEYLSANGAAIGLGDIGSYYAYQGDNYNPNFSDGKYIVLFDTSNGIGGYTDTGTYHAVVIIGSSSNGGFNFYDPQNNITGTFTQAESNYLTYAGY